MNADVGAVLVLVSGPILITISRMSKAEIIAELPRLSPQDRAEVQAKLDELARHSSQQQRPAHIRSPRLADPRRAGEFKKQIVGAGQNA